MDILTVCAVAVTAAIAAVALKKNSPETSLVTALAGGIIIFLSVILQITPFINEISELVSSAGIDTDYGMILIKTIGICAVCQFTSDSCRDMGQSSLASRVELAAKLSIILISLPLFEKILNTAADLLQ